MHLVVVAALLWRMAASRRRPNVIVLFSSGVSWRPEGERIPHLSRLAAQGATVENFFLVLSSCAPARASFLTGLYPHAHGVTHNFLHRPLMGAVTYPDRLRKTGYSTGALFRKRLSEPEDFDGGIFFADAPEKKADDSFDALAKRAVSWLQNKKDEPYLLHVHFNDEIQCVNSRREVEFSSVKPTQSNKSQSEVLSDLDDAVGQVLDAVEDEDDTIVVHTTDRCCSSPGKSNSTFYSGLAYEELVRAPMTIKYPRRVEAGLRIESLIANVDVAPTLLELTRSPPIERIQGRSFASMLLQTPRKVDQRKVIYFRYYDDRAKPSQSPKTLPSHFALRTHEWKLIFYDGLRCSLDFLNATTPRAAAAAVFEFYDLTRDMKEMRNAYSLKRHENTIAQAKRTLRTAMVTEGNETRASLEKIFGSHFPAEACLDLDFANDVAFQGCLRDAGCPQDDRDRSSAQSQSAHHASLLGGAVPSIRKRKRSRVYGKRGIKRWRPPASRLKTADPKKSSPFREKRVENGMLGIRRRPCSSTSARTWSLTDPLQAYATKPYDLNERTAFEPFMYVHMQKAAGNTISHILRIVCPSLALPCESIEAVDIVNAADRSLRLTSERGAFVVGSVRNPFDWYVSLFAFGCSKKGSFFSTLRDRVLRPGGLIRILDDPTNVENFRIWMRILFNGASMRRRRGNVKVLNDARHLRVGFMTYRFAILHDEAFGASMMRRPGKIKAEYFGKGPLRERRLSELNFCSLIRVENLTESLASALHRYTVWKNQTRPFSEILKLVEANATRKNAAVHGSYRNYYDNATRRLVEEYDAMLLSEFGYEF